MKFAFLNIIIIVLSSCTIEDTAKSIIDKSIAYHDPDGVWDELKVIMDIKLIIPDAPDRLSTVKLDMEANFFSLKEIKELDTLLRVIDKDSCRTSLNGLSNSSQAVKATKKLRCEDAQMYRDYYTYLYGLPMKLRDVGTLIDPNYQHVIFNNKEYVKVKVTYSESVGKDTWYFYFDPISYAMEAYQFYHDETQNDGEYILLKEIVTYRGLKIPKIRHWFVNKDERLLGTDILTEVKGL